MAGYVYRKNWKRQLAACLDAVGFCLTFWMRRDFDTRARPLKKILAARIDHLGDALLLRPALQALRQVRPECEIHLLTTPENQPIFLLDPFVDKVIPFAGHWFQKETSFFKQCEAFFKILGILRHHRYDAAFDFRGDLRMNLLLFLAGIPIRYGYGITGGGWLLTHRREDLPDCHQVERNIGLLKDLGVVSVMPDQNPPVRFPASVPGQTKRLAGDLFTSSFAVIHAGAGNPQKEWPPAHFKKLAEKILAEGWADRIVWIGTLSEKKRGGEVSGNDLDLRGQTDLHELAFLLQNARFFAGNDSGPAHLAAAQGIPAAVIASSTNDIRLWQPWSPRCEVILSSESQIASVSDVAEKIKKLIQP